MKRGRARIRSKWLNGVFCAIYLSLICAAASSAPSRHAEVGGAQAAAYGLKAEQAGARVRDVSLISEICCVRRRLTYLAAASSHSRREPELVSASVPRTASV